MDVLGYMVVLFFIAGLLYRLVFQVKRFKRIKRAWEISDYKRRVFANCMEILSVGGLLVSMVAGLILRVLLHLRFDPAYGNTLDSLSMISLVSLCLFLIAVCIIEPGDHQKHNPLMIKRKIF